MESLTIFILFFIYIVFYLEKNEINEIALKNSIISSSLVLMLLLLLFNPNNNIEFITIEFIIAVFVGYFNYIIQNLKYN